MNNDTITYFMGLSYQINMEYIQNNLQPYYFGTIEELPGCVAHGKTEEELMLRLTKAKKKYFEDLFNKDIKIPEPGDMELRDWDRSLPRSSRVRVKIKGWTHHD
ncbi:type II toxin-antitoxin system HicB family antitoxin [Paenibacillus hexagrammi]|uniref:Type II toxin-antitoxin system HicB family antitoxin n=1 Tax=Paenibacillus hexagrammi TaxID=2908839 RepID=A0ABY3SQV8_9BACL|nr:type II toxin-antitoxin system HicB family antitoxin [Paenibacillus sp. YPD9-1]UJF35541.1 type II toxin-antitoxin system HicB family antitoxin [Paenibacillus sp. YPD9-1]